MSGLVLPLKFLLALALGAVIGLEREAQINKFRQEYKQTPWLGSLGGLRTFTLISLIGALVGVLNIYSFTTFSYIFASAFFVLLCAYYVVDALLKKATGLTTELAALLTFMIGFLIITEIIPIQLVIALGIMLSVLMSYKDKLERFAHEFPRNEWESLLSFAIIALVILPFLPNKTFYLSDIKWLVNILQVYGISSAQLAYFDIFNPFQLWLIVVFITGLDVFGFVISKLFGKKKGIIISSLVAGFISSTLFTISLSKQDKATSGQPNVLNWIMSSIMLANLASFVYLFILIAPLNSSLLLVLTPTLCLLLLSTFLLFWFFYYNARKHQNLTKVEDSIKTSGDLFSFSKAFIFACELVLIRIIAKICLVVFGEPGYIASLSLASLIGMDTIAINLAETFGKILTAKRTVFIFLSVNSFNLISKVVYSFIYGSKKLAWRLLVAMLIIICCSWFGYLFIK